MFTDGRIKYVLTIFKIHYTHIHTHAHARDLIYT